MPGRRPLRSPADENVLLCGCRWMRSGPRSRCGLGHGAHQLSLPALDSQLKEGAFNTFKSRKVHPTTWHDCLRLSRPPSRSVSLNSDAASGAPVPLPCPSDLGIQPPTLPPLPLNAATESSNFGKTPMPWPTHYLSTLRQHHLLYFRVPGHKLGFRSCFPSIR